MPRVLITVPDQKPQPYRFQLDRQEVKMGRGSDNDIAINCGSVSVHHAVMERTPGGYQIRDLGSTNGTKLDGKPQPVITLRNGLSVKLGDVAFDFSLSDEEKEALAREKPPTESKIIAEEPEEKKPEPKKPASRPGNRAASVPQAQLTSANPAHSFLAFVVFLILAALAFYIGLSIRHQKETHQTLLKSMSEKGKNVAPPAAPAASAE
jgi:hypothetical protein